MSKYRASITIDSKIAREIDEYYRELVKEAAIQGNSIPKLSNVYEEIITKGWELVKKELKKR
ncbi:MAG: hypothetical protein EX285_00870 [Thaumarchaeota archaeon]|nr:hypothetical protein [Nitrososphaerota archaeon]